MGLESYRYNDTSFDDPYFHSTEHFTLSASSLGDYSEEVPTTTITNDTIDTSTLADGNLDFTTTSSIISNLEAYQTKATKSVMSATLDSTDSTGFVYSQNETAQLYKNNIAATTGSITCNVDPANNLDSDSKPIYNATPYTQNYVTTLKPGNFAYDFKTVGTGSTAIFVADVTNSYNTFTADNELVTSNTITFAYLSCITPYKLAPFNNFNMKKRKEADIISSTCTNGVVTIKGYCSTTKVDAITEKNTFTVVVDNNKWTYGAYHKVDSCYQFDNKWHTLDTTYNISYEDTLPTYTAD